MPSNGIIRQRGVTHIAHYLDDFIIAGPPTSSRCSVDLQQLVQTCSDLRVPLAVGKCEGPSPCLTFLGIRFDTTRGILSLPPEKLERIQFTLRELVGKKACSRRNLESLIGLLNHACKVVRPSRSFLRRMLDLLMGSARTSRHGGLVRLNKAFRADLAWWREFVAEWNGVGFTPFTPLLRPHSTPVELVSDASGTWGCGAFWGTHWFQIQWSTCISRLPIAAKELLPIIVGCAIWGLHRLGLTVTCRCDNQAVAWQNCYHVPVAKNT